MLEPSAVTPSGDLIEDEVRRLIIRRHRHSPDVASIVGADWAERLEPNNVLVDANAIEDEIAEELKHTWLHPAAGVSPYSGGNARLFPWTLANAFLSSPAAFKSTVSERLKRLDDDKIGAAGEIEALTRLTELADKNLAEGSAKYDALRGQLDRIGISNRSGERVVIFAERVSTLHWLRERLLSDLRLKDDQIRVLHGGISDVEQQEIVGSFKQESSPIRIKNLWDAPSGNSKTPTWSRSHPCTTGPNTTSGCTPSPACSPCRSPTCSGCTPSVPGYTCRCASCCVTSAASKRPSCSTKANGAAPRHAACSPIPPTCKTSSARSTDSTAGHHQLGHRRTQPPNPLPARRNSLPTP
jgi:hypothetical protein